MEPYNFTPPGRQNQEPDANNQWFNSLPAEPLPAAKSSMSKKPLVFGGAAILLLGSVIGVLLLTRPTVASCLTTEDYATLTGTPFQDTTAFSPSDSFYDVTIDYENGSSNLSDETIKKNEKLLGDIAAFHERSTEQNKSVTITLTGGYTKNDTKEAAEQRIAGLLSQYTKVGGDPTTVQTPEVYAIESGDELSEDSAELATASVYLTVASDESCQP